MVLRYKYLSMRYEVQVGKLAEVIREPQPQPQSRPRPDR